MRVLLIALVPLLVAANEPAKPTPKKVIVSRVMCQPKGTSPAQLGVADTARIDRARPLNEMPPAKQQLSVVRTIDGCGQPTVVRENIGG